jgi:hypothetical protein
LQESLKLELLIQAPIERLVKLYGQTPELKAILYEFIWMVWRRERPRFMANYPQMLTSLCNLVAEVRSQFPEDRLGLANRDSKPILANSPDECLVFGDLVRMTLGHSIECRGTLDDWMCANLYLMFPHLSPRTQLILLLVAEQLDVQGLPTEDMLCIASEMTPCQLIRVLSKALDFNYLCNPNAALFDSVEALAKLLPINEGRGHKHSLTGVMMRAHTETRKGGLTDLKRSSEKFLGKYKRMSETQKLRYQVELTRVIQLLVLAISKAESDDVLRKVLSRLVSKARFQEFQVQCVAAALQCFSVLETIYEAKSCWVPAFQAACLSGHSVDMKRYMQNCATEPEKAVLTLRALEAGVKLDSSRMKRYVQHSRTSPALARDP